MVSFKNKKKYSNKEIDNYDFLNENSNNEIKLDDDNQSLDINISTKIDNNFSNSDDNISYIKTRKVDLFSQEDKKNIKIVEKEYTKRLEIKKMQDKKNKEELEEYEKKQKKYIKSNFKF